jgi:hypothetical protein
MFFFLISVTVLGVSAFLIICIFLYYFIFDTMYIFCAVVVLLFYVLRTYRHHNNHHHHYYESLLWIQCGSVWQLFWKCKTFFRSSPCDEMFLLVIAFWLAYVAHPFFVSSAYFLSVLSSPLSSSLLPLSCLLSILVFSSLCVSSWSQWTAGRSYWILIGNG